MKKLSIATLLFALWASGPLFAEDTKVTVYGHTGCPWTAKTLKYLDKKNVSYTLMDVRADDDANRDFYARGFKKIPQVLIADERIQGWRKGKLKALLLENGLLKE